MYSRTIQILIPVCFAYCVCVCAIPAAAQTEQGETLGGPDSHETGQGPHGHLFGDWGDERTCLEESGVKFDLQYVSDSLANVDSERRTRYCALAKQRHVM